VNAPTNACDPFAEFGPASEEGVAEKNAVEKEGPTISRLHDSGGLYLKGINGERVGVYEVLATIL